MNPKRILYVALSCLLILAVLFAGSRLATPGYKGKTLSEWLDAEPNSPPGRTRSENEWKNAIRKLGPGALPDPAAEAVPTLCLALTSPDGITTEEAARALGLIGTSGELAVPALIKYLREGDKRHRKYAVEGLQGYGRASREAMPLLQEVLNDENHDARSAAAELIKQLNRGN